MATITTRLSGLSFIHLLQVVSYTHHYVRMFIMGYSSLSRFKSHLRLEQDPDTVYDEELQGYLDAAEDYVSQFLNRSVPWSDTTTSPVTELPVPASVHIATYMLAADLHENREAKITGITVVENSSVMNMLWPYRVGLGV